MPVNYNINTKSSFVPALTDTIPTQLANRLGSGLPLPLNLVNNSWGAISGPAKVRQDVMIAVMTAVGSRMVFPSYGSLVPYLMFEEWTQTTFTQMQQTTLDAVANWVPTVSNVSVAIDETQIQNQELTIAIFYTIKGTNSKDSVEIVLYNKPTDQLPPANFQLNNRFIFQV